MNTSDYEQFFMDVCQLARDKGYDSVSVWYIDYDLGSNKAGWKGFVSRTANRQRAIFTRKTFSSPWQALTELHAQLTGDAD